MEANLDPAYVAINALALSAAMACAYCAPNNRDIKTAVWLVAANWFLFILSYVPRVAPAFLLNAAGVSVEPEFLWAMADAACAGAIVAAAWNDRRYWGIALWALYMAQCGMHVAYNQGVVEWEWYRDWLQDLFLAQIAVFLLLGGRGAAQRTNDFAQDQIDKLRDVFLLRTGRGHDE